jgi:hypothetical protein
LGARPGLTVGRPDDPATDCTSGLLVGPPPMCRENLGTAPQARPGVLLLHCPPSPGTMETAGRPPVPPCSAGYPGRSREWLRPHRFWLGTIARCSQLLGRSSRLRPPEPRATLLMLQSFGNCRRRVMAAPAFSLSCESRELCYERWKDAGNRNCSDRWLRIRLRCS